MYTHQWNIRPCISPYDTLYQTIILSVITFTEKSWLVLGLYLTNKGKGLSIAEQKSQALYPYYNKWTNKGTNCSGTSRVLQQHWGWGLGALAPSRVQGQRPIGVPGGEARKKCSRFPVFLGLRELHRNRNPGVFCRYKVTVCWTYLRLLWRYFSFMAHMYTFTHF